MLRDLLTAALAICVVAAHAAAGNGHVEQGNTSAPAPSANVTPTNASAIDPAAVMFATDVGLMLHAVKPGSVADYEAAIVALQEALAKSTEEEVREVARGWRVYKAAELDAKANPLYVHVFQPTVRGVDYRPSLWLDKLLAGAPAELLAKYRDAFAVPPSKLALSEFAQMSVAPVNASPKQPQQRQ